MDEAKYESLHLIIKERTDGVSWFEVIHDYITQDCEGGGGDCITEDEESDCDTHEHEEFLPCTCGLESFGGSSGTLQQCYDREESVHPGLKFIDLARAVSLLSAGYCKDEGVVKAIQWAEEEIKFEESWDEE